MEITNGSASTASTEKRATAPPAPVRDRPVDEIAATLAKNRLLPRPPGKKLTFDEMQQYFSLLTLEMWHHVVLYLYRDWPRIIRKLKNPDTPKYIDCQSRPVDMDYMIEHHGGGRYSLTAWDTEAKIHSEHNKLFDCEFEVNSSKYEPKLNYEELDINHKGNMAYVQMLQHRGIIDTNGQLMATQVNAASAATAAAQSDIVKQILEFASKMTTDQQQALRDKIAPSGDQSLSKSVGEILLEKMKQDDPNKHLVGLLGIIKEVLATNKPADGSTQMLERIMAMSTQQLQAAAVQAAEHQKTMFTLFEKVIELNRKPETPPPNPQLDQLEQIFSFAERLSGMRGGGGNRNGWEIGLDYVKELATPVMQTVNNIVGLSRGGRPMPPVTGPAAAPGGGVAFDPYADPASMRALSQTRTAAAPPPPAENPAAPADEITVLVRQCSPIIVQHLNMGTPGHVVGEYVSGFWGNGTHAQICSRGEAGLVQILQSIPEAAMFGEVRLRKFVTEFINFQEYIDAEQEDGEDEPEIVTPEPVAVDGGVRSARKGAGR